jgi:hypothetical protein
MICEGFQPSQTLYPYGVWSHDCRILIRDQANPRHNDPLPRIGMTTGSSGLCPFHEQHRQDERPHQPAYSGKSPLSFRISSGKAGPYLTRLYSRTGDGCEVLPVARPCHGHLAKAFIREDTLRENTLRLRKGFTKGIPDAGKGPCLAPPASGQGRPELVMHRLFPAPGA